MSADPSDLLAAMPTAGPPEQKIAAFFDSLAPADDLRIGIYQVDPTDRRRRGFLFAVETSVEPFELCESILTNYGPGEYEASARDPETQQYVQSERFSVGPVAAKKKTLADLAVVSPAPSAAAPAASSSSSSESRIERLLEQQTRALELMAQALSQRPPQTETRSALDMLKEIAAYKELLAPQREENPTASVLAIVRDVLALKDQLQDSESSGPLDSVARHLAPLLSKAIDKLEQPMPQPTRIAPRPPAESSEHAAPKPNGAAQEFSQPSADDMNLLILHYLGTVIGHAKRGLQPQFSAAFLVQEIDPLPDEVVMSIVNRLDAPDALDQLAKLAPAVDSHREYLQQTIALMLNELTEVDQPAEGSAEKSSAPDVSG